MPWIHSGTLASYSGIEQQGDKAALHPTPVTLRQEQYLIYHGYLVPFFRPSKSESERHHIRERLNMELCDRVFRISDARDVARDNEPADEAIAALMKEYEVSEPDMRRGVGRVLFGRIVSRIRTLSKAYLDLHKDHDDATLTQAEIQLLKQVHDLYQFVMVEHPDMFACVRLFDGTEDVDGIIEEIFSEIGKTQQLPIEAIYANRAQKIGAAMSDMDMVAGIMQPVIMQVCGTQATELCDALQHFTRTSARLVGIPSSDHLNYDKVASLYVSAHDAVLEGIQKLTPPQRSDLHMGQFTAWLLHGISLIHSMQNLRDGRPQSILNYRLSATEWHPAMATLPTVARG